jgi:hypothetical protein
MNHTTESFKITNNSVWSRLRDSEYQGETYVDGHVVTAHGIVNVYCEYRGKGYTSLEVGVNGRVYRRTMQEPFSKRYLVTLARRFAEEMAKDKA